MTWHTTLKEKYHWYHSWHEESGHPHVHWIALLAISFFFTGFLLDRINSNYIYTVEAASVIGTNTFTVGWATFGQVVPQGVAFSGLQVGAFPTQTDIKNRWPDGSIKFAVVTANITNAGSYAITTGGPSAGPFTPSWPQASVSFTIGGSTYTANLPSFNNSDCWLSGPQVSECRIYVTPTNGGTLHDLLSVIFDVRSYNNGQHRVDISVDNVKDKASGNSVNYDVVVRVNNSQVYSKSGVVHYYLTRWRKTFGVNLTQSNVNFDFTPFYGAKVFPKFLNSVDNLSFGSVNGADCDILTYCGMTEYQPSPGFRADLGYYPAWVVAYLVHQSTSQKAMMLKRADLSGSWTGHITDPDGKSIISLDTMPNYWLDSRGGTRPNGPDAVRVNTYIPGTTNWMEDAHSPAPIYVPYLVTGDRYYLDQQKFWGNFAMISIWPNAGPNFEDVRTGTGLIDAYPQPRGWAWALRNLADTAAIVPDSDIWKNYFVSRINANVNRQNTVYGTADMGPLEPTLVGVRKACPDGSLPPPPYTYQVIPWEQIYLLFALDHSDDLGFGGNNAMRDRLLRFLTKFWTSEPDYPRLYGGAYFVCVNGRDVNNNLVKYTSMDQILNATYRQQDQGLSAPTPLVGYYGPINRALMVMAVKKGITGASGALTYLESYPSLMADATQNQGQIGYALASSDQAPAPTPTPTPSPTPQPTPTPSPTPTPVPTPTPLPTGTNVALASSGATASASSIYSSFFPVSGVINGDRRGSNWGFGGGWNDGTSYIFPDWLEVTFNGAKTINKIDIFTLQDNYLAPVEPLSGTSFTQYGIKSFDVQYWNGNIWVTLPGGSITNNNLVWRTISFNPVTTSKIRVLVNTSVDGAWSRIVELEAYNNSPSSPTPTPVPTPISQPTPIPTPAPTPTPVPNPIVQPNSAPIYNPIPVQTSLNTPVNPTLNPRPQLTEQERQSLIQTIKAQLIILIRQLIILLSQQLEGAGALILGVYNSIFK